MWRRNVKILKIFLENYIFMYIISGKYKFPPSRNDKIFILMNTINSKFFADTWKYCNNIPVQEKKEEKNDFRLFCINFSPPKVTMGDWYTDWGKKRNYWHRLFPRINLQRLLKISGSETHSQNIRPLVHPRGYLRDSIQRWITFYSSDLFWIWTISSNVGLFIKIHFIQIFLNNIFSYSCILVMKFYLSARIFVYCSLGLHEMIRTSSKLTQWYLNIYFVPYIDI